MKKLILKMRQYHVELLALTGFWAGLAFFCLFSVESSGHVIYGKLPEFVFLLFPVAAGIGGAGLMHWFLRDPFRMRRFWVTLGVFAALPMIIAIYRVTTMDLMYDFSGVLFGGLGIFLTSVFGNCCKRNKSSKTNCSQFILGCR